MKRYRLVWPDDLTTTYRNTVVEDPRPTEIICDEINYASIENKPFGLNVWANGNEIEPKYVFYSFPLFTEYLGEV